MIPPFFWKKKKILYSVSGNDSHTYSVNICFIINSLYNY
ncbi:hypothetical protein VCHA50O393_150105 [Vibrio chagasii]|nr:hypothetical protein VCHA50O393_150105 [Vibrio chagasii]